MPHSSAAVFHPAASFKQIRMQHGFDQILPCAIDWCVGHSVCEADAWEELAHRGEEINLLPGLALLGMRMSATPTVDDVAGISVNLEFNANNLVSLDVAVEVARHLRSAAGVLEAAIDSHPGQGA